MDCNWVFLKSDGSKVEVTLAEPSIPIPGDGKMHQEIGYHIRYVVNGASTTPNPIVIATEHA